MKAAMGQWSDTRISGKLHRLILALPHHQSLLANKILIERP
jgi:hypothetical protein